MDVSVSSVKAYQQCPARWLMRFHLKRVPRRTPAALTVGKMFHSAMEYHLNGDTKAGALERVTNESLGLLDAKAAEEWLSLGTAFGFWHDLHKIEATLEVEQPFSEHLSYYPAHVNNNLIGRPDRVVLLYGKVWHLQNRTLAASKNVGLYLDTARRNLHELAYAWALKKKYPQYEYGGTIFNIIRKLKLVGKNGKVLHDPKELMVQELVPINAGQVETAIDDIRRVAGLMYEDVLQYHRTKQLPIQNRDMDSGMFGSAKDPYFEVLMGNASLDDDELFMPAEERYATQEGEIEESN